MQVTELHDAAMVLHKEQAIEVLGEVEVLETHMEEEDNLKEVMPLQDQAFHMVLDPHQDPHLIQENHKALEAVEHPHQTPQEEQPHPCPIQEDHKALEVEVEDHHQAPQYRSKGGPPGPPGGLGNNPPNPPGPGGNPGGGGGSGGGGGGSGSGRGGGPGPAPVPCRQPRWNHQLQPQPAALNP